MSIGGFGGSIGGFDGIYLLLLTIGVIAILFGFLLLALRKIITMLVLVGGSVIALVLTVVIQQFLGDVVCSAGFFAGFMIYIAFATYAAKHIVLANVITLFALGLFMILFPLIFASPYIFAALWFPLTFVLFYLAVKGMKRIGTLFQQGASTGWTSRKEKPIPAGTFSDDSLSTGKEDDAEPDGPTVASSVALTTPVDGPDLKDHSRTEARILGEKRMLLWIRDSFGIESPKVETCIEYGDCYIYKIMDEDMNLHEVTVDQAGNIINYCNPERLGEKNAQDAVGRTEAPPQIRPCHQGDLAPSTMQPPPRLHQPIQIPVTGPEHPPHSQRIIKLYHQPPGESERPGQSPQNNREADWTLDTRGTLSRPAEPATGHGKASENRPANDIEGRVFAWVQEAIGASPLTIESRTETGDTISFVIKDRRGNRFLTISDKAGNVKRFQNLPNAE